jgi:hypothetical protein
MDLNAKKKPFQGSLLFPMISGTLRLRMPCGIELPKIKTLVPCFKADIHCRGQAGVHSDSETGTA